MHGISIGMYYKLSPNPLNLEVQMPLHFLKEIRKKKLEREIAKYIQSYSS